MFHLLQVSLPSSILGAANADPRAKALHEELAEVNKKILSNTVAFVPEHERSPSPEPVYDSNGLRLNTREIRAKDKLMQKRSDLIEELIKADPGYRPPADYRSASTVHALAHQRLAKDMPPFSSYILFQDTL